MGIAELIEDFVLVAVVPVRQFAFGLWIPFVLFVLFVGAERNFEPCVLVSDVSHNSNFRSVGSVIHNRMKIVKVVLTVFCLLGAIRRLFLKFGFFNRSLGSGFGVSHVKREGRYHLLETR